MAKILLIDDDPQLTELYKIVLVDGHHQVDTAGNGPDGLKLARARPYDLILLDIMMPVMNGIEVLQELKKDAQTDKMPVVVLSNVADEEYIKTALSSGAIEYILKTDYDPPQFLGFVDKVIASNQSPPATFDQTAANKS